MPSGFMPLRVYAKVCTYVYMHINVLCVCMCVHAYACVCMCVYVCVCCVCTCTCMCVCMYVVSTNRPYRSKDVRLLSSGHKRHCFHLPLFNHAGRGGSGVGRGCHAVGTLKRLCAETRIKRQKLPADSQHQPASHGTESPWKRNLQLQRSLQM